jgi:hypothetical protein
MRATSEPVPPTAAGAALRLPSGLCAFLPVLPPVLRYRDSTRIPAIPVWEVSNRYQYRPVPAVPGLHRRRTLGSVGVGGALHTFSTGTAVLVGLYTQIRQWDLHTNSVALPAEDSRRGRYLVGARFCV